jgi:hypothetical protein
VLCAVVARPLALRSPLLHLSHTASSSISPCATAPPLSILRLHRVGAAIPGAPPHPFAPPLPSSLRSHTPPRGPRRLPSPRRSDLAAKSWTLDLIPRAPPLPPPKHDASAPPSHPPRRARVMRPATPLSRWRILRCVRKGMTGWPWRSSEPSPP